MADPNMTWQMGMGQAGNKAASPQTWQQLNDYLQQQYNAKNGYDPNAVVRQQDANGFSFDAPVAQTAWNTRGTDANGFSTDNVDGLTLPGQTGTWMYQPNASGAHFVQMTGGGPNGTQYRYLSPDASGNMVETAGDSHSSGSFWNDVLGQSGLTGFVKDVLPIAATVASPFLLGAGAEGLAGAGAGAADAGAGAGWVSAEGGAGYAGGMAADAGGLAGGVGATSGVSGTAGTGASGGAETPGWTSAEGGSGYSGGAPTDGGAGTIGGAPVTSNPVANPGSVYGTTTPTTGGITWGQAAGAAAPIVGGLIQANSASNALAAQTAAAQQANATQRYFYDTTRADNAPFLANGTAASNALAGGLGIGPATAGGPASGSLTRNFTTADFNADPVNQLAFQYGMDQGTQAINRQASANGGMDSGAVLKALTRFGTDYGNTKASESYNRFTTNQNTRYNQLAGVAGSGQVASAQVGAAGTNTGNQISQNQTGLGNASGAASIATGNALSGMGTGAYNNYLNQQYLNTLPQRGSSGISAQG